MNNFFLASLQQGCHQCGEECHFLDCFKSGLGEAIEEKLGKLHFASVLISEELISLPVTKAKDEAP